MHIRLGIDMPVFVHVKVVDISVVSQRPFRMVQTVLRTPEIPQSLLDKVVYVLLCRLCRFVIFPVVAQRLFFMVQTVQQTMDTPRLLVDMVVNALIMQVVQVVRVSQVLVAKITVVIPQLQHLVKSSGVDKVGYMPVVCNNRSSTSHRDAEAVSHGPGLCRP